MCSMYPLHSLCRCLCLCRCLRDDLCPALSLGQLVPREQCDENITGSDQPFPTVQNADKAKERPSILA